MKKLLLSAGLLALTGSLLADSVPAAQTYTAAVGSLSTNGAVLYGRDLASGVLRQIGVDSSGALSVGAASITLTASPYLDPKSTTVQDVAATTALVVNLTSTAGVSAPCMVCLSSNGGAAAGFKVQFGSSATAPVNLTSTSVGHYIAASSTGQCWGPFKAGTHVYAAGVAAVSSVIVDIQALQ
jgi:hypothetical protein